MATYTKNLNLKKPDGTDYVLVGDLNGNMDTLDVSIGSLSQLETVARTNLVMAINEAMKRGGEYAPYIDNDTLHWMMWDIATAQYVDTGVYAGGVPAGFGEPTITATQLDPDESATAEIEASGPDTAKVFKFELGIPQGKTGDAAGFDTPTATTETLSPDQDATVEVTATGPDTFKKFDFNFGIPKGDTGENAEITEVTATVDNTAGNPQVEVTMGGTPTRRTIHLAFTGLRGVDGTGAVSSVNNVSPDAQGNVTVAEYFDATLSVTGWTDNEQAVSIPSLLATDNVIVGLSMLATPDEVSAAAEAQLMAVSQSAGEFTIKALKEVPTMDIPILVQIVKRGD